MVRWVVVATALLQGVSSPLTIAAEPKRLAR